MSAQYASRRRGFFKGILLSSLSMSLSLPPNTPKITQIRNRIRHVNEFGNEAKLRRQTKFNIALRRTNAATTIFRMVFFFLSTRIGVRRVSIGRCMEQRSSMQPWSQTLWVSDDAYAHTRNNYATWIRIFREIVRGAKKKPKVKQQRIDEMHCNKCMTSRECVIMNVCVCVCSRAACDRMRDFDAFKLRFFFWFYILLVSASECMFLLHNYGNETILEWKMCVDMR